MNTLSMDLLRKWLYKPRKGDTSLLAQFYFANEELNAVASELDSFDGRKDPDRCSDLVAKLRRRQDKVLGVINKIMDEAIPGDRVNREFRAKFPDDVLTDSLAGELWFGAECLAAGSTIVNREVDSVTLRPLAKAVTRSLDHVRCLLRIQCLRMSYSFPDRLKEALKVFDQLFADFELSYVSVLVPVKSLKEFHMQQDVTVLMSETLQRALRMKLVTQEMVDDCDPVLMFTIPRLAIVYGLLYYPNGALNIDVHSSELSELFRPYQSLLHKIRNLLRTLSKHELSLLEKDLYNLEEAPSDQCTDDIENLDSEPESSDYIDKFYVKNNNCKQFITDFYSYNFDNNQTEQQHDLSSQISFAQDQPSSSSSSSSSSECSSYTSVSLLNSSSGECGDCAVCSDRRQMQRSLSESSASTSSSNHSIHLLRRNSEPPRMRHRHDSESVRTRFYGLPLEVPLQINRPVSPSTDSSSSDPEDYNMDEYVSSCGTDSIKSDCQDDEEIALAIQAAEIASHNEVRSKFAHSADLIHRLFVCISGVADQLQTNCASDLRNILKCVFDINSSESCVENEQISSVEDSSSSYEIDASSAENNNDIPIENGEDALVAIDKLTEVDEQQDDLNSDKPPVWMADNESSTCMACTAPFTFIRRRHHCRNCGKIFCYKCSSHWIPVPHCGHEHPVRVCDACYVNKTQQISQS